MAIDDATTVSTQSQEQLARATNRGTKIVKPGQEMDKNAFLRILSAELTNQDPTKAKDGSEFVAQMAQFASLEQMTNLNSTMAFSSSTSLVGKMVALNSYDASGFQHGGIVKAVFKESDATYLAVQLKDGSLKDFPADLLSDVLDIPDNRLDYLNGNMGFSAAITLMGKEVETEPSEDGIVYAGTVKSVFKDANGIKLTLAWQENGEEFTKDVEYESIKKVS